MKKRIMIPILCLLLGLFCAKPFDLRVAGYELMTEESAAKEGHAALVLPGPQDPAALVVDDEQLFTDCPPLEYEEDVLLPVRHVSEALGYKVTWNASEGEVTVVDADNQIVLASMRVGSEKASMAIGIYGVMDERILDHPARLVNNRIMVPAAFLSEALGCRAAWDVKIRVLTITQLRS